MMARQTNSAAETKNQAEGTQVDGSDADRVQDTGEHAGDQSEGVFSELKDTARDAALAVLKPAVKSAAQGAAGYAVNNGPDAVGQLVKDKVGPMLEEAGGLEGLAKDTLSNMGPAGKVASKLGVGGKLVDGLTDDEGDGDGADLGATGSGRRMPVQQAMDVAVPLETAYNQWTQFEEYPSFMQRVDSASQDDDTHVTFTEKMWGFSREFKAEIVEQRPNERIVWRSESGLKHAGVVTFHELAERLTRIEVTVDFKPESLFQKFARGARFSKRAIRADMHRFKAYIEMSEEEDGAWRGLIEDGEVVEQEEHGQEDGVEEAEGEEVGASEEEPQAEYEDEDAQDEPQAEEEPQEEAEEEPQEEAEEEPQEAPAARRRKTPSGGGAGRAPRAKPRRRPAAQRNGSSSRQRRSPQRPKRPARARAGR